MYEHILATGWQVKVRSPGISLADELRGEDGWVPAPVPGTVHEALWAAGRIGDPYSAAGQAGAAWIAEREFLYRCRFDLPAAITSALEQGTVQLCCDGLDTIATVWLNGQEILRSDNMFVPAAAVVTPLLRAAGNELWISFESALLVGRSREARHGQRPVWNGDGSRVYVRKAQYQYGWDFGPTLLSAGPWRPIRLCAFTARIAELHAPLIVSPDLASAELSVDVTVETAGAAKLPLFVALSLKGPDGVLLHESRLPVENQGIKHTIAVPSPALWWPIGHGAQPLYRLAARLSTSEGKVLDEAALRLGARRLRLVQEPLADGQTFYFEVNNRPIFCGGANWIPPDLLPSRNSKARYRALLEEAVAANMTMIRVWGGGIYEEDSFYDLCDELGLLVWQDFLFACGLYPGHDELAKSVEAEATAAVRRLRHHPCLVLWAGNNEDYSIAASARAYHGPDEPIPAYGLSSLKKPIFDGRRLYEKVLARVSQQHDPTRPYWPGSPYSRNAVDPNSPLEGDRHIWEIWHFPMLDYQDYGRVAGRFASEFGMQAVPDLPTLRRALAGASIDENALSLLNKGQDGPGRIRHYIERNLPPSRLNGFDDYVYATQLIQAEALAHAVRAFRRQFDARRQGGGALVWQLDDCWPGVSWSMLSFCDEGEPVRRKPSIYAVRRELAPWALGLAATGEAGAVSIWAIAPPAAAGSARLRVRAYGIDGVLHGEVERAVTLLANQANELGEVSFSIAPLPVIYCAQLFFQAKQVARAVLWPQPQSRLLLLDPELQLRRDGDTLHLSVTRPAKGVLIRTEPPLDWSDNLIDLLPDEPVTLHAPSLGEYSGPLQVRSLFGEHTC